MTALSRLLDRAAEVSYHLGLSPPWSRGYLAYRWRVLARMVGDPELLRQLQRGALPDSHGRGLDERCVEYPWVFSRLESRPQTILDAGATLNYPFSMNQGVVPESEVWMVNLLPEPPHFWRRGVSYLRADLRRLPLRDQSVDTVVCISTLEHVGWSQVAFCNHHDEEPDPDGFLKAASELWRVLKPGGRLLLTLPWGRPRPFESFRLFDAPALEALLAVFGGARSKVDYFAYFASGWRASTAAECSHLEYVPWIMQDPARRGAFPTQADGATASRAVVCVEMTSGNDSCSH